MAEIDTAHWRHQADVPHAITWSVARERIIALCDEIDRLRADLEQTKHELAIVELNDKGSVREVKRLNQCLATARAEALEEADAKCRDMTKLENIDQYRMPGDDGKAYMHGYIDACNECGDAIRALASPGAEKGQPNA